MGLSADGPRPHGYSGDGDGPLRFGCLPPPRPDDADALGPTDGLSSHGGGGGGPLRFGIPIP